jgi:hypothetical protein
MRRILKRRPSPAMITALVALFVALGGTAIAAKQLKLGALTDGAKNKTVGVGKLTYVTTTKVIPGNTPAPNGEDVPVSAACPSGLKVLGGGIKVPEPPGGLTNNEFIDDSYPTASGWAGRISNFDNLPAIATTTAICGTSRVVTGAPPAS